MIANTRRAQHPAALALALALAALPQTATANYYSPEFEMQVIELVNQERALEGLAALGFDLRLRDAARSHSFDMAVNGCTGHASCDGTEWFERVWDFYPQNAGIGENVAAGYDTPAAVVTAWMGSPGHRANILNTNWQGIGVGYYYLAGSEYSHYWTQNFGTLAPIPEPEAYAMMLAGLGLLGFVAHRRGRAAAA